MKQQNKENLLNRLSKSFEVLKEKVGIPCRNGKILGNKIFRTEFYEKDGKKYGREILVVHIDKVDMNKFTKEERDFICKRKI